MRFKISGLVGIAALIFLVVCYYYYRTRLPCPSRLKADRDRTTRIVRLLDETVQGRRLLANAPDSIAVCFDGSQPGFLRTDGIAVLSKGASDSENAARLGHLLFHLAQATDWPSIDQPSKKCKTLIAGAIEAEMRAHELENDLRRKLRLDDLPDFDPVRWKRIFKARCQGEAKGRPKPR